MNVSNIVVKHCEKTGFGGSVATIWLTSLGDLTKYITVATAWVSFFIAVFSLLVMIEKYTEIDVPFIKLRNKKEDE